MTQLNQVRLDQLLDRAHKPRLDHAAESARKDVNEAFAKYEQNVRTEVKRALESQKPTSQDH